MGNIGNKRQKPPNKKLQPSAKSAVNFRYYLAFSAVSVN